MVLRVLNFEDGEAEVNYCMILHIIIQHIRTARTGMRIAATSSVRDIAACLVAKFRGPSKRLC